MSVIGKVVKGVVATGTLAAALVGVTGGVKGSQWRSEGEQTQAAAQKDDKAASTLMEHAAAASKETGGRLVEGAGITAEIAGGVADTAALAGAGGLLWARRRRLQKEAQQNNGQAKS